MYGEEREITQSSDYEENNTEVHFPSCLTLYMWERKESNNLDVSSLWKAEQVCFNL